MRRRLLIGFCFAALGLAGCGSAPNTVISPETPAAAPSAASQPAAPGGSGAATPDATEPLLADLHALNMTHGGKFRFKAEHQSLAVAQYFDAELGRAGWKRKLPKSASQPGQRKWYTVGPVGFTDGYDAAWVDPRTGRVALLNLSHRSDDPGVQHGEFEIFEKATAPL